MDVCKGTVASEPPEEVLEIEGSVYSSVSGVSQTNLESLVDRRLQEQDSKLDSNFENFADLIRNEMWHNNSERFRAFFQVMKFLEKKHESFMNFQRNLGRKYL